MAYSNSSSSLICISVCTLLFLTATGLPLEQDSKETREISNNFGFPDNIDTIPERPNNGCFVLVNKQYIEQVPKEMPGGEIVVTNETKNITVRQCCEGYSGKECNIPFTNDPFISSNPCREKTCPNDPSAICAVVNQCGQYVPLFLDDFGQIVDCGTEDEPAISSNTIACRGFCSSDPCAGQTCAMHPTALCLTLGCDCEPVWLLITGVRVNCTTGEHIDPLVSRRRRQVSLDPDSTTNPASCNR